MELQSRIVAVIRLDDLSQAVRLSEVLIEGGITALEFTLSNPDAIQALATVAKVLPTLESVQLGLGSVTNPDDVQRAVDAGASFIVSPHTNPAILKACQAHGVLGIPGALTPTEIMHAVDLGAPIVKVFPASTFGPKYFKDILAPLPHLKLIPTGGVNLDNLQAYLKNGAVAVGVGGNLVDSKLIAAGDWDTLLTQARQYSTAAQEA